MIVDLNLKPSDRQLRQFGLISLVALPILGVIWSGGNLTVAGICLCVGIAMAAVGWYLPKALLPVFVALSLIFLPIGLIISELSLLLIYWLLLAPIGLVFRLIKRDNLRMKIERDNKTYWQDKQAPDKVARYFNQY